MSCLLLIKSSSGGTLALKNLGFHYKSLFGPDYASIFFSQGWWIIRKFGMVMGDTSNDVTGALIFYSILLDSKSGVCNSKLFNFAVSRCLLESTSPQKFISYVILVQTLKHNAFVLLVRCKIDLYAPFLSILYSAGEGDQKLLYAELLEHEACCDHFFYYLYYFSTYYLRIMFSLS